MSLTSMTKPATPKKKLEYIKKWTKQNPEKSKANAKRYRERHKAQRAEYIKKYDQEHKAEKLEAERQRRLADPEKYRANYKKYNLLAKDTRLVKRILFLDKRIQLDKNPRIGKCSMCGTTGRTEIHHIKYHKNDPLKDTIEVCAHCHRLREQLYNEWRTKTE